MFDNVDRKFTVGTGTPGLRPLVASNLCYPALLPAKQKKRTDGNRCVDLNISVVDGVGSTKQRGDDVAFTNDHHRAACGGVVFFFVVDTQCVVEAGGDVVRAEAFVLWQGAFFV